MPGLTCACVCPGMCVLQHHAYGLGAKWIQAAKASIPLQATLGLKAASARFAWGQRQLRQGAPTDVRSDRRRCCLVPAAGKCTDRSQCFIKARQGLYCQRR